MGWNWKCLCKEQAYKSKWVKYLHGRGYDELESSCTISKRVHIYHVGNEARFYHVILQGFKPGFVCQCETLMHLKFCTENISGATSVVKDIWCINALKFKIENPKTKKKRRGTCMTIKQNKNTYSTFPFYLVFTTHSNSKIGLKQDFPLLRNSTFHFSGFRVPYWTPPKP